MFGNSDKVEQEALAKKERETREKFVHDCAGIFQNNTKDSNTLKADFLDISAIVVFMKDYNLTKYKIPNSDLIVVQSESGNTYHLAES